MSLLFGVTALALFLQVALGILLGLPASRVAWNRRWWLSAVAAPISLVIVAYVGGLLFAVPSAIVLAALYLLFGSLPRRTASWARFVHGVVGMIVIAWALRQAIRLPMRYSLGHEPVKIAANVAGLGLSISLTLAFVESLAKTALGKSNPSDRSGLDGE